MNRSQLDIGKHNIWSLEGNLKVLTETKAKYQVVEPSTWAVRITTSPNQ